MITLRCQGFSALECFCFKWSCGGGVIADNDHLTSYEIGAIDRMKDEWTDLEFADWTLLPSEAALLANKTGPTRLGFAVLLKFFQYRRPISTLDAGSADDRRRLHCQAGRRPGRGVLTL